MSAAESSKPEAPPSRLGSFIQTYSSFLSSFVIGVAGLIATSIWQWRQAEMAQHQAAGQQKLAEIKADNDWRIERAEILSKNLSVLSSHGVDSAEQRYGVLLSLTRGAILDPELAVSYALELGKDNASYMRSVLSSTGHKNYTQLLHAFGLDCMQRYGTVRQVDVCKPDKNAQRSSEIAQLFSDELSAATHTGDPGPMSILMDEQQVQNTPGKLAWLFEPYLTDLYERRQIGEIEKFEKVSVGAHLVSSLVLATAHTGEFVTSEEAAMLATLHQERRHWLANYLLGRACDAECKSRLVDVMLSVYGDAQGDYDDTVRKLIFRPHGESGPAVARIHQRLLWCQIDPDDQVLFRDNVLIPALVEALGDGPTVPQIAPTAVDDLAALLAVVPTPDDPTIKATFEGVLDKLRKLHPERYQKSYVTRRNVALRERKEPPPVMKKLSFCNAPEVSEDQIGGEE